MPLEFGNEKQIAALREMEEPDYPELTEGPIYPVKLNTPNKQITHVITNIDDRNIRTELSVKLRIPDCLTLPLEFGNEDQLAALRYIAIKADDLCDVSTEREYEVTVHFSGSFEQTVYARTRAEAEEKAKELADDFDLDDADIDVSSVEVDET